MAVVRPIGHEERLSIVDHLDELRSRLIACVAVLIAAFGVCYWQNEKVLEAVNQPLEQAQQPGKGNDPLEQSAAFERAVGQAFGLAAPALSRTRETLLGLADEPGVSAGTRAAAAAAAARLAATSAAFARAAKLTPKDTVRRPVTLGVAEPFVATFTVAGYAALLLALPFILFQLYSFVVPAFSPDERRVAVPLMALVPVLFIAGVLFGYYVALPRAVDFLQNFNDDQFDILVQARDYYRFVILFLALMGLVFQIPVGVLALTRARVVDARTLWKRQGYVILGISIVAAVATPTPDPVTMLVTMLPLVLLYELSIGLAWLFRPRGEAARGRWGDWDDADDHDGSHTPADPAGESSDPAEDPARVS